MLPSHSVEAYFCNADGPSAMILKLGLPDCVLLVLAHVESAGKTALVLSCVLNAFSVQ